MAYKDLLVKVDESEASAARIDAAIALADRFNAHLTALYLIPEIALPVAVEGYVGGNLQANIDKQEEEKAAAVLDGFRQAAGAYDIEFDTRTDKSLIANFADQLGLHSRYADLLIIGQPDVTASVPYGPPPEDVVLNTASPVLVVPFIGPQQSIGKRAMVAWNASKESARAVKNAMPFLEQADTVDVVTFRAREGVYSHGPLPGADIALHLARHGINVDVQQLDGGDIDVGNTLLSHAADRGSDLLVMGCYGHSRLREMVLGGATRTILRSMTIPVMMAH